MENQSSRYILPFSIFVILALVFLLVFSYLAETNGWFSRNDELVNSLTLDQDPIASFPISFTEIETELRVISQEELQAHATVADCYTVINDNAYALPQDFIEENESDVFDKNVCAKDITDTFETQVDYVITDLADFLLGEYNLVVIE